MAKKNKKGGFGKTLKDIAGVTVASLATYMLMGPEGKKNRKQIKSWAVKMKGDVIEKLEEMKEVTEPVYHQVVEEVSARYQNAKNVDTNELKSSIEDLKKHWKQVARDMVKVTKNTKKTAKKVVKKVTK